MKKCHLHLLVKTTILVPLTIIGFNGLNAQSSDKPLHAQSLSEEVLRSDALFWEAYNTCNLNGMKLFLVENLEFYHDKNGLTSGLGSFMKSLENGICANANWRLRREAVKESIKIYPLKNYGAILSGEHYFYVKENGKTERLDGKALFTHVWQYKNNGWKMSRILSYDHQPVAYKIPKVEIEVPDKVLDQYLGEYESSRIGSVTIAKEQNTLTLQAGEFKVNIYAETENLFFVKERDLQFEFVRNEKSGILKIFVHENGRIVEEIRKIQ